jgi:hypothetical protein
MKRGRFAAVATIAATEIEGEFLITVNLVG